MKTRICVIGAGPGGMSALYSWDYLKKQGRDVPEIVCYEKQADWGGEWRFEWRTGTDEYGEPVHNSMYKDLWVNILKETMEKPDFTWRDFSEKPLPSCVPRQVMFDYYEARWKKYNLRGPIKFLHSVQRVSYDEALDSFGVTVKDLAQNKVLAEETFSHVIVASGAYSTPNMPDIKGLHTFPGEVVHSKNVRSFARFKDQRVLVVGSGFSAEDAVVQLIKFGAREVATSFHRMPLGYLPEFVKEHPFIRQVDKRVVTFEDDERYEADSIILCTGYITNYPFLEDSLRATEKQNFCVKEAYKGVVWLNGGTNKLLYLALRAEVSPLAIDVEAWFAMKVIMGDIKLPSNQQMREEEQVCFDKLMSDVLSKAKSLGSAFPFLIEYCLDQYDDLQVFSDFPHRFNNRALYRTHIPIRLADVLHYRNNEVGTSTTSGMKAAAAKTDFMKTFDVDETKDFMKKCVD